MKRTLRVIGLTGFILFAVFFGLTFSVPGYVEDIGKEFIKQELQERTDEKIDSLSELDLSASDNKVKRFAGNLLKQNQEQIAELQQALKNNLHEKLADVIAEMRDLDCECRNKYAAWIEAGFKTQMLSLQATNEKLVDFMKGKYMQIAQELQRDVRTFTGSTALIFLLIFLVSLLKPQAVLQLFLPAVLLTISTLVVAFFYVFEQNWLMTIIYSDYWGYSYFTYIGIMFLFLCDVVFNGARVTTEIVNGIFQAIGVALQAVPC